MQNRLVREIFSLYEKAATQLPEETVSALEKAKNNEAAGSTTQKILETILENIKTASEKKLPMCQDTGTPIFHIKRPISVSEKEIISAISEATVRATEKIPLRPNSVDIVSGKNSGDNLGKEFPVVYFEESDSDEIEITLFLKGGGSENIGQLYSLPNAELNAARNIEGVRKCVLDAIFRAQGKGCAPGFVGVGIAGSRDTAIKLSKKQLLRSIGDKNPIHEFAELENQILKSANELGIGPMGLGGVTTALAVKIAAANRHPASFFVDVSFGCWAQRVVRGKVKL